MTKPIIAIHNIETDEFIEREMNNEEYADYLDLAEKAKIQKETDLAKEAAKETAQAKLATLGLTTNDLKALGLGAN